MSGSMRLCCATLNDLTNDTGDTLHIEKDSIDHAWNSAAIKKARQQMIKGEPVSACVKCVEQEARGYESVRETDNKERNFARTKDDGSVDHHPTSMELHLGNVCNLKCKMCGQQYSNQIGKELLEIGEKDQSFLKWIKLNNQMYWTVIFMQWLNKKKSIALVYFCDLSVDMTCQLDLVEGAELGNKFKIYIEFINTELEILRTRLYC